MQFVLTPGQAADVTQAQMLLEGMPFEVVIGDKGFDSQKLVDFLEAHGAEAVIPSRKNNTEQRDYDRERYKDRNLVERFWNKLKHYRRVATRYEKNGPQLFGIHPCGIHHGVVAVTIAAKIAQLVSTRPRCSDNLAGCPQIGLTGREPRC